MNCEWNSWSEWADCSNSCDEGIKTRTREEKIQLMNGGKECDGDNEETMVCDLGDCK